MKFTDVSNVNMKPTAFLHWDSTYGTTDLIRPKGLEMYVILVKDEVVKRIAGPYLTKDKANEMRKAMKQHTSMKVIVRKLEEVDNDKLD